METWIGTIISSMVASVISALISGILIYRIQKKIDREQKIKEEMENSHERALNTYNELLLKGLTASLSLGEATADAVENGRYNGKQHKARKYAEGIKHEIQDFMNKQGVKHLQ